jgi:hypothetical protein
MKLTPETNQRPTSDLPTAHSAAPHRTPGREIGRSGASEHGHASVACARKTANAAVLCTTLGECTQGKGRRATRSGRLRRARSSQRWRSTEMPVSPRARRGCGSPASSKGSWGEDPPPRLWESTVMVRLGIDADSESGPGYGTLHAPEQLCRTLGEFVDLALDDLSRRP